MRELTLLALLLALAGCNTDTQRLGEAMEGAGRQMQAHNPPPKSVDVTVSCAYGPGRC